MCEICVIIELNIFFFSRFFGRYSFTINQLWVTYMKIMIMIDKKKKEAQQSPFVLTNPGSVPLSECRREDNVV